MELVPTPADKGPDEDFRVRLTSKRRAAELLRRGAELLRSALDGQPEVAEETRRGLEQQLLANFDAAVRLNVLVDGQPWDEAPDVEDEEILDLESLLDDAILQTASRRRYYPKQIRPHVVSGLKAQRKVLGLYQTSIQPEHLQRDPEQETIMSDLAAAAPGVAQQTVQVSKAIAALQQQAQGLCEVLQMKPSSTSLQIHREVLGSTCQPEAPPPRSGRPIRRAAEEAAAMGGYVAGAKNPRRRAGGEQVEGGLLL